MASVLITLVLVAEAAMSAVAAAPTPSDHVPIQMVVSPPEPEPEPHRHPEPSVWDLLAACESGGNWATNTGNGYYGGLQFNLQSWQWAGGSGYPHEASRERQIEVAERLLSIHPAGWGAWPACSRKLGLR